MQWLFNLLPGASRAVNDVAAAFKPNAEAQAGRDHEHRQTLENNAHAYRSVALGQYAAEFAVHSKRTWFDSFVDGFNRLVRPTITLMLIAVLPAAFIWPSAVDVAFAALASLPDAYWAVLSLVLAFYFGGRMQLKSQDFARERTVVGAVVKAQEKAKEEKPPVPEVVPTQLSAPPVFEKPNRSVSRVFLHCTASDYAHHDNIQTIRDWHVNDNGWSDVGYHYLVTFNGSIEKGRPMERTPAAQKGHNKGTIAIALSGGQGGKVDAFTKAQFDTLKRLCRHINDAYGGQITFHGHSEVAPGRACPVYDYKTILGLDDEGNLR